MTFSPPPPPPPQQPYGGPPPFTAPVGPTYPPPGTGYGGGAPGYPPLPPWGAFEQPVGPVPPAAWLVPVAAVLAVVGACLPWFHGTATVSGHTSRFQDSLYSWADGRIGLLPPVALVLLSVAVVALLRGRSVRRFSRGSTHPVVSAARTAMILGGVSLVCVVVAWFLVPTQYKFDDGLGSEISWNAALDKLRQQGVDASFSRGPQLGYFLTIAAAVLVLLAGALMLVTRDRTVAQQPAPVPPGWAAPPPPVGFQPGHPPPAPPGEHDRGTGDGRPDLTK